MHLHNLSNRDSLYWVGCNDFNYGSSWSVNIIGIAVDKVVQRHLHIRIGNGCCLAKDRRQQNTKKQNKLH